MLESGDLRRAGSVSACAYAVSDPLSQRAKSSATRSLVGGLGISTRDLPMSLTLNNFDRWAVVPHNFESAFFAYWRQQIGAAHLQLDSAGRI